MVGAKQYGTDTDTEVAVVGCGPVGNTLALLLAQAGHRVVAVDRRERMHPQPRAVHLDGEVARIFQACGIGSGLRSISEPAPIYEWRSATGTTLLRFGRLGDGPSGWPESLMFHQPDLEALLDERARSLPDLDLRRGFEVSELELRDDLVVLRTPGGKELRARYVVGCDGANSTVRSLIGSPMVDLGFFYDWLIVDVILDEDRKFDPLNIQICDPARPTTAVSGGPGRRRWEFMRMPGETVEEISKEERVWELLSRWDVHPGNARIDRRAVYTFRACYAERWRDGRVLLAGDAAHLMPPFAGQGMCAGARDAANLAWKLDAVLAGHADEILLDTYQQERLPGARAAIEFSVELGKVICVSDPVEAARRDEAMAAAVGPDPVEAPAHPAIEGGLVDLEDPNGGHLFVQGTVGGHPFDDVHGAGWRLVALGAQAAAIDSATRDWFGSIGGRIVELADPDATYRGWFADHRATVALQRPDFHIFGTAGAAHEAPRLLGKLRSQLHAGKPPIKTLL